MLPRDGRVLDVGAGTGHSAALLAPRESVAVDVDPDALSGQGRLSAVADMRALPFPDASFASAVSIQSIEHVPDPDRALAEIARVLAPGGVAVIVTPNRLTFGRPDEIIDPYHYVELDAEQLRALCAPHFASVELRGLFGSDRYLALVGAEHARLDALLRRDPLRLRRLVRRRARGALDRLLARARNAPDPRAAAISRRLLPGLRPARCVSRPRGGLPRMTTPARAITARQQMQAGVSYFAVAKDPQPTTAANGGRRAARTAPARR